MWSFHVGALISERLALTVMTMTGGVYDDDSLIVHDDGIVALKVVVGAWHLPLSLMQISAYPNQDQLLLNILQFQCIPVHSKIRGIAHSLNLFTTVKKEKMPEAKC